MPDAVLSFDECLLLSVEELLKRYQKQTERPPPKYNCTVRITESIRDFKAAFPYQIAEHLLLMHRAMQHAWEFSAAWQSEHEEACSQYNWKREGPLISGIGHGEKFPDDIKERLRFLAHGESAFLSASLAHWKSSLKQAKTWRTLKREYYAVRRKR